MKNYSIRDRSDQGTGLSLANAADNSITTYTYQMNIDSRDCIGQNSLNSAQLAFELAGGRGFVDGIITNATGIGVSPIKLTLSPLSAVALLQNGDKIVVKNIQGNTNALGAHIIDNINYVTGTVDLMYTVGDGNYKGQGTFVRYPDKGYPHINENSSIIRGSTMIIHLGTSLKDIREIIVDYVTIPRDLIPIQTYMIDLVDSSTSLVNKIYEKTETNWSTFIPQEEEYMEERLIGFYSTPLDIFRSYIDGAFSLQDSVTPSPLDLWNPPIGPWPLQPLPYPFQTVPTYQSNEFSIPGSTKSFHIVLSGYGLYDLNDWTSNTGIPVTDAAITSIARKLLLLAIVPIQSYNNVDYINLILACNTVTPGNVVSPFGYGDFQRFIPGPGLQLNYQPATSDNANPAIASPDWAVPFPNFNGNVWGPYDKPGDRFQKLGLRSTLQDLFLNGDTNNLLGNPIIKPNVPTEYLMDDSTFGINFSAFQTVDLNNIASASNLNILNAMRIIPNGFGAKVVRASGQGNPYYTSGYKDASGQGPSSISESSWANKGVYGNVVGTINNPIAIGPSNGGITPQVADPSIVDIPNRYSWSDSGTNNGQFMTQINNYIGFTINDIPDTDIVMFIEEALKNERSLSTNNENVNANFSIPMRLNLGTVSGTIQYMESIYSLLSGPAYWNKRFLTPKSSLNMLHITFKTYEGQPIDLEKMLQPRKSTQFLQTFTNIIGSNIDVIPDLNNFQFFFLFDPFNPKLWGRMKRYIQMILKIECYQMSSLGLIPDSIGNLRDTLNDNISSNGPNMSGNEYAEPVPYENYS